MVRHGESEYNQKNIFTGWLDAGLSERGIGEAKQAGQYLKEKAYTFDVAYTSVLKRAIHTLDLTMDALDLQWLPVHKTWRLNERMYGGLQGLNKSETATKFGEDQVKIWRRAYGTPPPPLEKGDKDPMYPGNDPRYKYVDKALIPLTESLKDTVERVMPYWFDVIVPSILRGEKVLIAAHGNSLRALVKYLDNMAEKDIVELNIPTGIPLVYELDECCRALKHYYLADEATVKAALDRVTQQGKAKQ